MSPANHAKLKEFHEQLQAMRVAADDMRSDEQEKFDSYGAAHQHTSDARKAGRIADALTNAVEFLQEAAQAIQEAL